MRGARAAGLMILALLPLPGTAQGQGDAFDTGRPELTLRSEIITLDADRLFSDSRFGQKIAADIQNVTEELAAENRRIAQELEAEELALTEQRPEMDPDAFRAAAEEFDARVQEIRRQQDAKERDITARVQRAQEAFLGVVRPVLGQIMIEAGAVVILDRRTVVLGRSSIDITDSAIARIDEEIGDGPGLEALEDAAEPAE